MPTLFCHIKIREGKETEFEAVMKSMYRSTLQKEPNCVRYEYFRAAQPGKYYSLLSFTDRFAFLQHQVSDYHEGFDFASMLMGIPRQTNTPIGWPPSFPRALRQGVYLHDDWKASPKLTVNLGLRFDYNGNPIASQGLWGV